jgi:6-pyruvoyltetrahydropterin/6-carboxytetrahydropterin synthase
MPSTTLTQRYPFSASHRLHAHVLSEDENRRVFGKCNNPHGHGHNYLVELSVSGVADPVTGLLVERHRLDAMVEKEILAQVAHRNLNEEMAEFSRLVPTTENLAKVFTEALARSWSQYFPDPSGIRFDRVRIYETRNNLFEMEAHEIQQ